MIKVSLIVYLEGGVISHVLRLKYIKIGTHTFFLQRFFQKWASHVSRKGNALLLLVLNF